MIVKSVYCSSDNQYAMLEAQRYVCNKDKVPSGGIFSYGCGEDQWCSSGLATKILHRKKERGKHYQIIAGFDPADRITVQKAVAVGKQMARFFNDRIILGAVHNNTQHIHIHLLVSYTTTDGQQRGMKKNDLSDFKSFVSDIAKRENLCPVRMHNSKWNVYSDVISKFDVDLPEFDIDESEYLGDPGNVIFGDERSDFVPNTQALLSPSYIAPHGYSPNGYGVRNSFRKSVQSAYNQADQPGVAYNYYEINNFIFPSEQYSSDNSQNDSTIEVQPECEDKVNPFVELTPESIRYVVLFGSEFVSRQQMVFPTEALAQQFAQQMESDGYNVTIYTTQYGLTDPIIVL